MVGLALMLFTALAAVVVVASSGQHVEAVNDEELQRLRTKLEVRGVKVASVQIDGDTVTIERVLSDKYGVEDELGKWAAYRVAAEEGFSWLELTTQGAEGSEGHRLRLLAVPHAGTVDAGQAIASWIADVEAKTGVKAASTFRDYRLDLVVQGPREAAPAAAERFMQGGVGQHEHGNLDVLTIVVQSGEETVFEGVADYVVGVQARLHQASDLSFDW